MTTSVDQRGTAALFALMVEQHGVASCAQARELGVSRSIERRLLREGALVAALPGILAAGGVAPAFRARAMAAALRPGVVAVSHGTAARLHGLEGFADYPLLDVIGVRGSHLRLTPPVISHFSRGPLDRHVTFVGAVPTTSIALTVTLLAATASRATTERTVVDALRKGVAATAIRAVAEAWREPGRAGPGVVLAVLSSVLAA